MIRRRGDGAVAGGALGVGVVLVNRLVLAGELPAAAQSRVDLLSAFACCFLMLDGISRRDVETNVADSVRLVAAQRGKGFSATLTPSERRDLDWTATTLLDAMPDAATVVVWDHHRGTLARVGALGAGILDLEAPPTLRAALDDNEPTYLPDLQALPARVDFSFLPPNTPAVLLVPSGTTGIIIIAANRKRPFSPRDLLWASQLSVRLASLLGEVGG